MSTGPFLPTYRDFPTDDPGNLQRQLAIFHNQTNIAVNNRTIGSFQLHQTNVNDSIANGERWFPSTGEQRLRDGFRVVVQVSDAALTVNHNITMINQMTRLYGAFFDGTSWQTLPYVDVVAAANQIKISVSSTQIVVTKGGGAPAINSGIVVLEYL
jgi:hypothetical protein